jgi:hypothetical protein
VFRCGLGNKLQAMIDYISEMEIDFTDTIIFSDPLFATATTMEALMNLFFDLYNNGIYRVEVEPFESTIDYFRKWGFSYIDNSNERMFLDLHKLSEIKELKSYNDYPRIYLLAKRLEGN